MPEDSMGYLNFGVISGKLKIERKNVKIYIKMLK